MLLTPIIQILAYTTFKTLSLLSNTESVRSVNTHSYTLRSLDWYTPPLGKHKLIHSSTLRREHQHVHNTQRRTHTHTYSHAWWLRAGWGVSLWRVSYLSALISPGRHMNGLLFLHAIYQRKRVGITKTTSPMMHFSVPPALSQAHTACVGRFYLSQLVGVWM